MYLIVVVVVQMYRCMHVCICFGEEISTVHQHEQNNSVRVQRRFSWNKPLDRFCSIKSIVVDQFSWKT